MFLCSRTVTKKPDSLDVGLRQILLVVERHLKLSSATQLVQFVYIAGRHHQVHDPNLVQKFEYSTETPHRPLLVMSASAAAVDAVVSLLCFMHTLLRFPRPSRVVCCLFVESKTPNDTFQVGPSEAKCTEKRHKNGPGVKHNNRETAPASARLLPPQSPSGTSS